MGLTDALVEGKFVWQTTQDDVVFVDWAPREPNDMALRRTARLSNLATSIGGMMRHAPTNMILYANESE